MSLLHCVWADVMGKFPHPEINKGSNLMLSPNVFVHIYLLIRFILFRHICEEKTCSHSTSRRQKQTNVVAECRWRATSASSPLQHTNLTKEVTHVKGSVNDHISEEHTNMSDSINIIICWLQISMGTLWHWPHMCPYGNIWYLWALMGTYGPNIWGQCHNFWVNSIIRGWTWSLKKNLIH